MKKTVILIALLTLIFMPINAMARQGELTVGAIYSDSEIDLDNAKKTAGININDGIFTGEVDVTTFDNQLNMKRTGVSLEYGITDNLTISGIAGIQQADTTGLIELGSNFAMGVATDTKTGFFWSAGAEYAYELDSGITPFIKGLYSQGKNDIEAITLSMLGLSVTLPDAINEIGGMFSPNISSGIGGDINIKMLRTMAGIKKTFDIKGVDFTPFIGVSYLMLDVDTNITVGITDGWNDITVSLNGENEANEAIGAVAGLSISVNEFLTASIEANFLNEKTASIIGGLVFRF